MATKWTPEFVAAVSQDARTLDGLEVCQRHELSVAALMSAAARFKFHVRWPKGYRSGVYHTPEPVKAPGECPMAAFLRRAA